MNPKFICVKLNVKVRGVESHAYRIGHEIALKDHEVKYLDNILNSDKKIAHIDNFVLAIYDINDTKLVEKLLCKYWEIIPNDKDTINRCEQYRKLN